MKTALASLAACAMATSLLSLPAMADTLTLSLSSPVQTGAAGSTLTFDATVSALSSNTGTIFLNGDSANLSLTGASIDDSGFLFDFPLTLDPSQSFTGELFTVDLPSPLPPGAYDGFFSILGGSDGSAQDTLATASFEVDSASPVPEPASLALFGSGLSSLGMFEFRRRRRTSRQS